MSCECAQPLANTVFAMQTAIANPATEDSSTPLFGPGLGETQRAILLSLKRHGSATQAEIGHDLHFAAATLREHLRTLTVHGFVERRGNRHGQRGRPEVIYGLTHRGEALFPHREAFVLGQLVTYLMNHGHGGLLDRFFSAWADARRRAALPRLEGLDPAARFAAVARLLSAEGYMAQEGGTPDAPTLRVCHCPLRDLVAVTQVPCRYEHALFADLLGRPLERVEFIADGRPSCTYRATAVVSQPQPESIPESAHASRARRSRARVQQEHAVVDHARRASAARHGGGSAAEQRG